MKISITIELKDLIETFLISIKYMFNKKWKSCVEVNSLIVKKFFNGNEINFSYLIEINK